MSGTDAYTAAETGSLISGASLTGADTFTAAETGTLMAFGFLAGVGQKAGSITKTGSLFASAFQSGADVFTASETGSLMAAAFLAGAKIREKGNRAGTLAAGARTSGADVFIATELGTLLAAAVEAGGRNIVANRAAALMAQAFLSGVGVGQSATTMLDPIWTGRIAAVLTGFVDNGAMGRIGDTVGGLDMEPDGVVAGSIAGSEVGSLPEDVTE